MNILTKLKEKPNTKLLTIIFIVSLLLSIISIAIFFPLIMADFPEGATLMDIKAAWTVENMNAIIEAWDGVNSPLVDQMIFVHYVDLFFMVFYGTAIFSGLLLVSRGLSKAEKLQKIYIVIALISTLSVIADLVEEIFLLLMLFNPTGNITLVNVVGANLSATICVYILYPCALICLIGSIIQLIVKKKN